MARVLILALEAHGFHPRQTADGDIPGMPGVYLKDAIPIDVPADEAEYGRLLAADLIREMTAQ